MKGIFDEHRGVCILSINHLLLLPLAISCAVTAVNSDADNTPCAQTGKDSEFLVDIHQFLLIAGWWQIGTSVVAFIITVLNIIREESKEIDIDSPLLVLFYLPYIVWSICGLILYDSARRNKRCPDDHSIQMVLAWSITQIILTPFISYLCIIQDGGYVIQDFEDGALTVDTDEQRDLVHDDDTDDGEDDE